MKKTRKKLSMLLSTVLCAGICINPVVLLADEADFESAGSQVMESTAPFDPVEDYKEEAGSTSDEVSAQEAVEVEERVNILNTDLPESGAFDDEEIETISLSGDTVDVEDFLRGNDLNREFKMKVPAGTPVWRDDRTRVRTTDYTPYNAICQLELIFRKANGEKARALGTGFFISDREILTCAHCLYDRDEYGDVEEIIIRPGLNGSYELFSPMVGAATSIPVAYTTARTDEAAMEYDFGLIQLSEKDYQTHNAELTSYIRNGKKMLAYLRLNSGTPNRTHVSGYPAQALGASDGTHQYEDWGTKTGVNGKVLESDVTGSGGQSGSPQLNSANEAAGIYGFGYTEKGILWNTVLQWGGGRKVTSDLLNYLSVSFSGSNMIEKPVYRLYNPNSGEHVYTMNYKELQVLVKAGWHDEGMAWRNDRSSSVPVYRLYNKNAGDHHYTSNKKEYDYLVKHGWLGENIMWYAPNDNASYATVYRLYNPNAKAGSHHFTTNKKEYDQLVKLGWKGENKAFSSR